MASSSGPMKTREKASMFVETLRPSLLPSSCLQTTQDLFAFSMAEREPTSGQEEGGELLRSSGSKDGDRRFQDLGKG